MHHLTILIIILLVLFCIIFTLILCRASRNWRFGGHDYELDEKDTDTKKNEESH